METKKIYLGKRLDSTGNPTGKEEYWKFDGDEKERSPHAVLIGGSGCGKTEALKAMCFEMKEMGVPSLTFDFHNDFSELSENLISLDDENASINPLDLRIKEKPIDVAYKISDIFSNIFELTEIQQGIFRSAIKRYYFLSGIKDIKKEFSGKEKLLPFSILREILMNPSGVFSLFEGISSEQKYKIEKESSLNATEATFRSILTKLEIVFDTDLFMRSNQNSIPFKTMLSGTSVIQLHKYPTDNVKRIISEILIRNLINHFYFEGKSEESQVRLFCIIDEGHRMVYEGSPIDLLLRESRKYGVGCILASQGITDFSENVFRNVGITFSFSSSHEKDISDASKSMGKSREDYKKLDKPGKCFVKYASIPHESVSIRIEIGEGRPKYLEYIKAHDEKKKKQNSEEETKRIAKEKKEKEEYEELKKKFPELEKELMTITKSLMSQKEKNEKLSANVLNRENEIANLKSNFTEIEKELFKSDKKCHELEISLEAKKKEYSTLLINFNKLDKENKENFKTLNEIEKKLSQKEIETKKIKSDLDLEKSTKALLELQIKNKFKEVEYIISKSIFAKKIIDKLDLKIDKNLKIFCKKCGSGYSKHDTFCDLCGEKIK